MAATEQLEALSEEIWSVKTAQDDLIKERDALLQQLAKARASTEKELAEEKAAKEEALGKQAAALSEKIAAARSESQATSKEVEALAAELAALKASKEAMANELVVLSEELATTKTEREAALEAATKAFDAQGSSVQASLKDANAALDAVLKEKGDLAAEAEKQRRTLSEKDAVIERLTKEHEEHESEVPSLKEELGHVQALANEKGAALDNLKKGHETQLNALLAELAEVRLMQRTGTGDGEVSTSTSDMSTPCHPPEGGVGVGDEGVVAIVRSPIF